MNKITWTIYLNVIQIIAYYCFFPSMWYYKENFINPNCICHIVRKDTSFGGPFCEFEVIEKDVGFYLNVSTGNKGII